MSSSNTYQGMPAIKLLFFSGLSLITGHLLLQQYMPNIAAGGIGFLTLIILFSYILFRKKDVFGFIMSIYICSHFSYGDNHGGLWNIVASAVLTIYYLSGSHISEFNQTNKTTNIFLLIFVFFNCIGWIFKNPMPITPLLEGASAFIGYILVYLASRNLIITKERIRIFLSITFALLIYQVAVSLIQYYALLDTGTPLVGGTTIGLERITESGRPRGTIGHFELFSEYALLMICLLIPLLSSSTTRSEIKFSYFAITIAIFSCITIIIITTMRGAFILAALVTIFYYILFQIRLISAIDKLGQQLKLIILVALLLPAVSVYIGMKELEKDFSNMQTKNISIESVATGKSINRGGLADIALSRMSDESWIFGYGSGTIESNKWAWFGYDTTKRKAPIADFHNLYVALPMLYGWMGALAFISIILWTFFSLIAVTIKYRKHKSFLLVISFGLSVMWAAFILHEYKISILRNANYQMLFWIWLGLSASVVKTIKDKWQVPTNSLKPLFKPLSSNSN